MQNIRIGNDISIEWKIFRTGNPEDFDNKNVEVKLLDYCKDEQEIRYSIAANVVTIDFQGKNQHKLGKYTLLLIENNGNDEMATIDQIDAFKLVEHTCEESGEDECSQFNVNSISLESNFIVEHRINVIDSVHSSSTVDALSARQGKVLYQKINNAEKTIPYKVSQLENDKYFVTKEYVDDVNRDQNLKINNLQAQIDALKS